mgnify:CR=1 FL=1
MKLIYMYDEFMRVPDNIEGRPIYIFDQKLQKNYQISDKIIEYRYFLAEQAHDQAVSLLVRTSTLTFSWLTPRCHRMATT